MSGRGLAMALGTGRVAMGCAFLAKPVTSVRLLGVDTATASRMIWLARMTAVRDVALGAGALSTSAARRGQTPWLLAGAFADAGDAAVLAVAVRSGRLDRTRGSLVAAGAVAAAIAGLASAVAMFAPRRRARQD